MELEKIRHAVYLTAQCRDIDYNWRNPEDSRYSATLWCNAIGEYVVGVGPDQWTAVQAAHAEKYRHENRRK